MSISPVANSITTASQTQAATAAKKTLSQEDFLNLFTTQLQYQNPLAPMDNYQMASQMSQFSMVNSLTGINESVNSLGGLLAPSLVGKKVEAVGNGISIQQGIASQGSFQLSKPGTATIQIFNANGQLVRILQTSVAHTSEQKFQWDGKDQQGINLPDGSYSFKVTAVDGQGQLISATTYQIGTITGTSVSNGTVNFQLDTGGTVSINDIKAITG